MRAYPNHHSREGRAYRAFAAPFIEAFGGSVPSEARTLLKLAGRLSIHIDEVEQELARARARHRRRDINRLRRTLAGMTSDLRGMMNELRAMAEAQPKDWAALLMKERPHG